MVLKDCVEYVKVCDWRFKMSISNLVKEVDNSILEMGDGMEESIFHPIESIKMCRQDSKYNNLGKCFGYLSSYVPAIVFVLDFVASCYQK
jgi:hypothetical protein